MRRGRNGLLGLAVLCACASASGQSETEPPAAAEAEPPAAVQEAETEPPAAVEAAETPVVPYPPIPEEVLVRGLSAGDWCRGTAAKPSEPGLPLCELAESNRERCPRFRELCSQPPQPHYQGPSTLLALARWFGQILTYLSWVVLGVLLAIIVVRLVVAVRRYRANVAIADTDDPPAPSVVLPSGENPDFALDPRTLLRRARQRAERGQHKGAMADALMAFLRGAELEGVLTLHGSRTNGEYARSLRERPDLRMEFRQLATEVEAVEFRDAQVAPDQFSRFYARIEGLLGKVAPTLLLLVAPFLVAPFLVACSSSGSSTPAHDCGDGPDGYSVLCETLRSRGMEVQKRYRPLRALDEDVEVIVVLRPYLTAEEQTGLANWTRTGGRIITAARFPDALAPLPKSSQGASCSRPFELTADLLARSPKNLVFQLPHARLLSSSSSDETLVVCEAAPFVTRTSMEEGTITSIGDPRLLTNASLAIDQNAWLVAALLDEPEGVVQLVGDFTGQAAEHPLSSLWRSGLTPWLIHSLLLGIVLVRARRTASGTPKPSGQKPRRSFAEHARALGYAYARAKASELALFHYGHWVLERLRLGASASRSAQASELSTVVASRLSMKNTDVLRTIVQVRTALEDGHDPARETEHLAMMRELGSMARKAQNIP
jgi:hypothetical protein